MSTSFPSTLSVSVVVYKPATDLLELTLRSVAEAVAHAKREGLLRDTKVWLIDNAEVGAAPYDFRPAIQASRLETMVFPEVIAGHGNLGYGRGHNLAIRRTSQDYHLILNPDVILAQDALSESIRFMEANKEVGLLAPHASNQNGNVLYLCKRYPTVFDLALRGFAPNLVKRMFALRLSRYELRSETSLGKQNEVEIISGCFMFARTSVLKQVGGFSDEFFMYFEDFDLSLRVSKIAKVVYVPSVRIVHFGGEAARKGSRHIQMFVESAAKFYRRNGWKLF